MEIPLLFWNNQLNINLLGKNLDVLFLFLPVGKLHMPV